MSECKDQLTEDMVSGGKSLNWVKEQDQVMGFRAADGEITEKTIKAFIEEMIDLGAFDD